MARDRHVARDEADNRTLFRVHFFVALPEHLNPCVDQKCAEDVDDEVKLLNQKRARADHHAAHHERAKDAPVQDSVLVLRGHFEVGEDEQEDEEIINRER